MDNPRLEEIEDTNEKSRGFQLIGYKGVYDFIWYNVSERECWLENLRKVCVGRNIALVYSVGKMIGKGSFAKVHLAQRKSDNRSFAIKTIAKTKILENPRNTQSVYKEISILRKITHPHIIKLYEVYENEMYIHLVIEYLKGGELFQRLQNKGTYSEKDASTAIKHVLEALEYCHEQNIVHRDLKPENLILSYQQL
jgi:serine/threonine protein kinase